jgi:hypothetical protein
MMVLMWYLVVVIIIISGGTVIVSALAASHEGSAVLLRHTWYDSFGRVISLLQRPLLTQDNTTQRQTSMPRAGIEHTVAVTALLVIRRVTMFTSSLPLAVLVTTAQSDTRRRRATLAS